MSDLRASPSRSAVHKPAVSRRLVPVLAVLIGAVLAIAWIDGGERALRPIVEDVALPPAQPAPVPELVPAGGEG